MFFLPDTFVVKFVLGPTYKIKYDECEVSTRLFKYSCILCFKRIVVAQIRHRSPPLSLKNSNMPRNILQGRPTAALTRDKWGAYAGNGVLMGKFVFKMKNNPKKKTAPVVAPQKRGRGRPQKRQPNQNDGASLPTA